MSQSTFEVLRFIHIMAGIFWTGTVIMLAFFLEPVVRAAGPSGGQIMHGLMEGRKLGICLMLAGWATILAGAAVFWRTSAHLNGDWMSTNIGTAYSIGAVAAIAAALVGSVVSAPAARQLAVIGGRLRTTDGPPSAEDLLTLSVLQKRLQVASRVGAVLLIGAAACMAMARYL